MKVFLVYDFESGFLIYRISFFQGFYFVEGDWGCYWLSLYN